VGRADRWAAADDQELVAAALTGSQEAYRRLVLRFERPLFSLIARMVGDPALAEDLAQETFVKAFRHLDTYDRERKFSSWLFKIAHNTALDHLRRREVATVALEAPEDDGGDLAAVLTDPSERSPEAVAQRSDLALALSRAVARLRPEYREVVLLRFAEGQAYQDIAEITGLPLGTVKTQLHRARRELMEALREMGWGAEGIGG
jgi:RNA polymerase sigma-70 factor, ECF subfamily